MIWNEVAEHRSAFLAAALTKFGPYEKDPWLEIQRALLFFSESILHFKIFSLDPSQSAQIILSLIKNDLLKSGGKKNDCIQLHTIITPLADAHVLKHPAVIKFLVT